MRFFPCFQDGQGVLVAWLVMDYVKARLELKGMIDG